MLTCNPQGAAGGLGKGATLLEGKRESRIDFRTQKVLLLRGPRKRSYDPGKKKEKIYWSGTATTDLKRKGGRYLYVVRERRGEGGEEKVVLAESDGGRCGRATKPSTM